ncbi:ABC transporter ATP-binding protein [Furfurilactobacillus entadae]|uniref:ABC transporter ATP-binding protein n=1 Tax=Furfurilactobacillus entadae TaxID=2922307 RepID=UPI0038B3973B
MMDHILSVEHLAKSYRSHGQTFAALTDVSFQIGAGEVVALLGPNGAGKTTTVSIIGGYLLPTAGTIIFDGQQLTKRTRRPNIGVSFGGELGFYGRATARQNLRLFADLAKVPHRAQKEEIARVLDIVKLSDVADKRVQSFSKGMTQRLHIARALLGDPKLLLLDEPTSGLDVEIAARIWATVADLVNAGTSVLLTSHTMTEVETLADKVVLLGAGKVFTTGTVAEIVAQSKVQRIDRPATLEESYLALAPQLRRR